MADIGPFLNYSISFRDYSLQRWHISAIAKSLVAGDLRREMP
jgi:hypothetical protein